MPEARPIVRPEQLASVTDDAARPLDEACKLRRLRPGKVRLGQQQTIGDGRLMNGFAVAVERA